MNRAWVEVDLQQLKRNVRSLRAAIPDSSGIIFVVKSEAYGHGMVPVARAAFEEGIRHFAVAYLDCALRLRAALPEADLLVIGPVPPDQAGALLEHRIVPIITDCEHGLALAAAARRLGKVLPAHLKIDTGMGRLGVQWDETAAAVRAFEEVGGLQLAGVCSHFAKVDPNDPESAREQARKFSEARRHLPAGLFAHLSASRSALYFPEWDCDAVRQGIVLYGYGAADPEGRFHTRPILQWKARVVQVKRVPAGFAVGYYSTWRTEYPTQIATIAVGYADGYNRALSSRGDVLIGGRRCAVVGRVSMNWITADIGPDAAVKAGDEAVLIGVQGDEAIWADELATICRTIPYEILTSIHASLERKYV